MTTPVAILSGGLGTRLGDITREIPKAMIEIAGKPFVVWQLELLRRAGIRHVVMCLGHLGAQIESYLGDGHQYGVEIQYSYDDRLGTGGAIRKALPLLGEWFYVLYGDSYLDCRYDAIERRSAYHGKSVLVVCHNRNRWDKSNVLLQDGKIIKIDKENPTSNMEHADYGLSMLKASDFKGFQENEPFDLERVYQSLIANNDLLPFQTLIRFYEIGSMAGLEETRTHLANKTGYSGKHRDEAIRILQQLNVSEIEDMAIRLNLVRENGGRVFFLGVGGGAANCSHAVNDFRKLCGIESYAPTDNVSELSARTNDEGWATVFVEWLKTSKLGSNDAVFVFSVGGGDAEKNISSNLVEALKYARRVGASIFGVVGRDGGYTLSVADVCLVVPKVNPDTVTPHTETIQAFVLHLLVSHPALKLTAGKWESMR
jgi:D-sedoheptulose 7-phosphate isomerase